MMTCTSNATSASSLNPSGVWTDGTRLVVSDYGHNRVLIWNTFPTANNQAADLVIGQTGFTGSSANAGGSASASTLSANAPVRVRNNQLFVADGGNNRVLIWQTFPTTNGQAADYVLGQSSFTTSAAATTQAGLSTPADLAFDDHHLFVTETTNKRVMIYTTN